ncbi:MULTISPECIES: pyridoxal phosphate-dependent aminotransferase [Leptospira]|uniref:Histidinol-phosphate transaminase n=1 Tax=Leptospira borgpetersenii serovar Javanica str. UI 09931 TaxID=1049767 RepID=A0AAV3J7M7_LEPBO|nr:histidinol-phosphate transaminase [Leptospira borgpetersenii]AXX16228.1 histidinol-phosphate aminotransferase family protein [Leptospira borgpetersenii serovar Ceylonica]EMK08912.1 putative histidinol-phosphate transaminase [Leptospira sp. serovar Kenya str. Sh9]EMO10153.1 putative histidinol-phosphate transaminase [Leptospira borgpetersenii str. Noumea 25]EKQ90096.1 putative histidinol-phosphate transaminase [Leptospira borgpetersenii str. UI 09149]EKR00451.1 putative histidinol-phosphate 
MDPSLERPDWQLLTPRPNYKLWLDKNENLDPQLAKITSSILSELNPLTLSTYPECGELYRKLAKWTNTSPQSLILTPGSDGAIRLTFEAFMNEGDSFIHTSPTFAMYSIYSKMFGAKAYPLFYEKGEEGPVLTFEKILEHIERIKPKLFSIPNPDSPTGTVLSLKTLRELIEFCKKLNIVILVDEAYHPFHEDTCVEFTKEFKNLIVARTFAKAWGLAGLRIGYAVGHPEIIKFYHKLRPMYEVSTISVAFMERMMDYSGEMYTSVKRLNEGKSYFRDAMKSLGFKVLNTNGNFQHVAFGEYAEKIHKTLKDRVLYRENFVEDCLRGYSRFSITTIENFKSIIELICKGMKDE